MPHPGGQEHTLSLHLFQHASKESEDKTLTGRRPNFLAKESVYKIGAAIARNYYAYGIPRNSPWNHGIIL